MRTLLVLILIFSSTILSAQTDVLILRNQLKDLSDKIDARSLPPLTMEQFNLQYNRFNTFSPSYIHIERPLAELNPNQTKTYLYNNIAVYSPDKPKEGGGIIMMVTFGKYFLTINNSNAGKWTFKTNGCYVKGTCYAMSDVNNEVYIELCEDYYISQDLEGYITVYYNVFPETKISSILEYSR